MSLLSEGTHGGSHIDLTPAPTATTALVTYLLDEEGRKLREELASDLDSLELKWYEAHQRQESDIQKLQDELDMELEHLNQSKEEARQLYAQLSGKEEKLRSMDRGRVSQRANGQRSRSTTPRRVVPPLPQPHRSTTLGIGTELILVKDQIERLRSECNQITDELSQTIAEEQTIRDDLRTTIQTIEHLMTRPIPCGHCGQNLQGKLDGHPNDQSLCPLLQRVPCAMCGQNIQRRDLGEHEKRCGIRPVLGIELQESKEEGTLSVIAVNDGSAAAKAGVLVGDIITQFDDKPIHCKMEFAKAVLRAPLGGLVDMTCRRTQQHPTLEKTITKVENLKIEMISAPPTRRRGITPTLMHADGGTSPAAGASKSSTPRIGTQERTPGGASTPTTGANRDEVRERGTGGAYGGASTLFVNGGGLVNVPRAVTGSGAASSCGDSASMSGRGRTATPPRSRRGTNTLDNRPPHIGITPSPSPALVPTTPPALISGMSSGGLWMNGDAAYGFGLGYGGDTSYLHSSLNTPTSIPTTRLDLSSSAFSTPSHFTTTLGTPSSLGISGAFAAAGGYSSAFGILGADGAYILPTTTNFAM